MELRTLSIGGVEQAVSVQPSERIRKKVMADIRIGYSDKNYLRRIVRDFAKENGYEVLCSNESFDVREGVSAYSSIALLIEDKEAVLEEKLIDEIAKGYENPLDLLNKLFEADLVIPS